LKQIDLNESDDDEEEEEDEREEESPVEGTDSLPTENKVEEEDGALNGIGVSWIGSSKGRSMKKRIDCREYW